jgi:excisionase family DNA binding protein
MGKRQRARESDSTYPSVDALAKELGIGRHACYAGLNRGTIPNIRIGRRFILPKAAISEWLKNAGHKEDTPTE